ncbi:serine hydrolase domain-containing protein [Robertkochia solimangrovi]|uniref:serine hydrolase domain-containing protein n=1 Tax=Robertkochia solimangrovi TaxID=2213046 RepID=UPI00117C5307|nr:serine hydrolase domain-containing protein [Robertkochia solimangrovi]TRZ45731.1 hypothetical protein DMZ48_00165 [Robertkochia solimangrovi]
MKIFLTSLTAVILLGSCQVKTRTQKDSELIVYADSIFSIAVDSSEIAGAAILIAKGDSVLLDNRYGFSSLELQVPIPEEAQFEIGSVTKQFTAAAILKLAEDGKLNLDDDFTQYLDFDTRGRKVTIRQLLDHTSGIPGYTEMPFFGDLMIQHKPKDTLVRLVEKGDFLFEPGEAMIYNNSAYFFLGIIIEKASGESYETYLEKNIFIPLKMEHTYYCSNTEIKNGKVYGYSFTGEGLSQKGYLDHTWPYAAGSLCSSTQDLYTWLKALHHGNVLDVATYKTMITPDTLNDGTPLSYAKGLLHFKNQGHDMIAHGGGINGFLSEARYFPDDDLYVICLVNTTGPKGAGYFADALSWELLDKVPVDQKALDTDLSKLVGYYSGAVRGRRIGLNVEAMNDTLLIKHEGREKVDTLSVFIGNNTWVEGNDVISFSEDKMKINENYGFYILKKSE